MYRQLLPILFLALGLAACADDSEQYQQDVHVVATMGSGLVLATENGSSLSYLKADLERPSFERFFEAKDATISWVRRGPTGPLGKELFALLTPDDARDPHQTVRLVRLEPPSKDSLVYELALAFGSVLFSPDGRTAILANFSGDEAHGFYNPGEIALLDLQAEASKDNPRSLTLDTKGRPIYSIFFLDPIEISGQTRRLAAVSLSGAFKLIDLEDPTAALPIVPLSAASNASSVAVVEIQAQSERGARPAMLFVRTNDGSDILAVSLTKGALSDTSLAASINQLDTAGKPQGLSLLVDENTGALHVIALANARLAVIDVDTADRFFVSLGESMDTLIELPDGDLALLGQGSTTVRFLAVKDVLELRDGALTVLKLHQAISDMVQLDELRFLCASNGSEALLIDLGKRAATRLYLGESGYNWNQGEVFEDTAYLLLPDNALIGVVDLAASHPSSLMLDDFASALFLLEDKRIGLAWHDIDWGRVTMFSLDEPTRATAVIYDGFLMAGVLD
ncbi:MAG: hypothetical protein MUC50_14380 [Myxococcota bacterium]|nr:hypothetical protein [Myxococcota bacterium]